MHKKRLLSLILGLVIGLALIAVWLSYTELGTVLQLIRKVNVQLVVFASIIYVMAYFVRSVRWNLLIPREANVSVFRSWLYSNGGNFINYMIPIRLGELVKAWFIRRNHGLQIMKTLPSIFIDKTFDTIGIFFVLITIPFLAIKLTTSMIILLGILLLVFVLSLVLILVAAFHQEGVIALFRKWFSKLPSRVGSKLISYMEIFIRGLNILEHHWTILFSAVLLTAVGVALDGTYFYLLFRAFSVNYPFVLVLFGYTLINLSYAIPQPPAQLGSNEWMMIIIFSIGFGLTKESASAIMVFAHVLTALIMSILGIFSFSLSGYDVLKAVYKDDTQYGN
ncbi:MAG TPA: lysylphosphatidylglycerol synthase transmembrane domain-containing protein [Candidatus Cloacimonadota bacterium]|nr:lysylphosphatidylglycerol synthase transmembrane domain-containing protein [Candidatus Cloacimonadota bacterium]